MSFTGDAASAQHRLSWPRQIVSNLVQGLALFTRAPRVRVRPRWRAYSRLAIGAAIALAATIAVMLLIDAGGIALAKRAPRWLRDVFTELTEFGQSEWFLVPLGILLVAIAVFATPGRLRFTRLVLASVTLRLGFLFMAIALPSLFDTVIKRFIGRARPYVDNPPDPFHYAPGVWHSSYASMPSGHTATAFAAAMAIGLLWPRLRVFMAVYALVIALSRVMVVAHFPSDVVAAAVLGTCGALLVRDWFGARRLGFRIGTDGSVHALSGPSFTRIKRVARNLLAS
jgi:membrane-associated phospholipid phosphatase